MVDSGANAKGGPVIDILSEKDEDGGYASGGWKRLSNLHIFQLLVCLWLILQ